MRCVSIVLDGTTPHLKRGLLPPLDRLLVTLLAPLALVVLVPENILRVHVALQCAPLAPPERLLVALLAPLTINVFV